MTHQLLTFVRGGSMIRVCATAPLRRKRRVPKRPMFLPNQVEATYYTDQNTNGTPYMLSKWKEGEYPVQTYDAKDWIGCLHGCALALTMLQDPQRTQNAIEDDGILHELIHILHFSKREDGERQLSAM